MSPPQTAASSSARTAACSRSRATGSPSPTRAPTPGGGSTFNLDVDAGQHRGRAHRPDGVEPQRRLQPRRHDPRPRPRPRPRHHRRRPRHRHRPLARRATRRSCWSTRTPASTIRSSPSSTRRRRATSTRALDHPPGAQPEGGWPLHRRPAPPEERRRRDPRAQPRVPRVPRPHHDLHPRDRAAPAPPRAALPASSGDADVGRSDLYLAWDFTVASERGLSERVLHIRDDAFASLQGGVPSFTVDTVRARRRRATSSAG